MSGAVRTAALLLLAMATCLPAAAQSTFAELRGTVVDEQGAAVPGAMVIATHVDTGTARNGVTSASGTFMMPALQVGLYRISVELQGFNTVVQEGVRLAVGDTVSLTFTLKVATVAETVTVVGDSPMVDTKRSGVSGRIQQQQVENLPLNGRDWLGLVALVPGARGNPGAIQAGSSGSDMAKYNVDGVDITNQCCGGSNQGYSQENVAEFVVLTNRFDAEHGRVGGAVINAVTKSGTNQLRATGFGYFRNKNFGNAKNFYTDTLDPLDHRQLGLNGGGPLVKDRAFYFASFEYQKQLLTARPNTKIATYDVSVPNDINRTYITGRLDTNLSQNHRLFVRGSIYNWEQLNVGVGGQTAVSGGYSRPSDNQDLSVGETWVISRSVVNEVRVGFSHINNQLVSNSSEPLHVFPSVTFGSPTNSPQYWQEMNIQLSQALTLFVPGWFGEHSMKAGVQIFRPKFWGAFPSAEPWAASYNFSKDATDFNNPATYPQPTRFSVVLGDPSYTVTNWTFGPFFQDNWTVNRHLTLNLGVRYDLETGTTNRDYPNPLEPEGRSLDANNISPRLGFAYDLRGDGRTVVRGGWGRYYDKVMLNITSNEQRVVLGRYLTATVTNPASYTSPLGGLTFDDFKARKLPISFIVLTDGFRTPVNDQLSIGFAQQLGARFAVQADYVHSKGKDEPLNVVRNFYEDPATHLPLSPATYGRPYPQYTNITWYSPFGKSQYDGLQVGLNGRGRRFSFQASYTLSKTKDNHNGNRGSTPTNPFALDQEFTYSSSDQRHRFVLNALVTLPWDIQAAGVFFAGSPRTINVGTSLDPFGLGYSGRWLDATGKILERNSERTDSDFKTDLRLSKRVTFKRISVQAIAEVFNIFNRENHDRGTYGTNYYGKTYLQPSTSTDLFYQPRQIQLGFRVSY